MTAPLRTMAGRQIHDWRSARQPAAILPQKANLAFPFTALEVVRLWFLAELQTRNSDMAGQAFTRVELAAYPGRVHHALPESEQQRCQLARVHLQIWLPVREGTLHRCC